MSILASAIDVLTRAESELRDLLELAASNGDYDAVKSLAELAQTIRLLAKKGHQPNDDPHQASARESRRSGAARRETSATPRSVYPRFAVDGDQLVKIGWSKSSGGEYEHRASRRIMDTLTTSLQDVGRSRRRFTMEEVLPLSDPTEHSEIPTYQVYLSLAWLRAVGLVKQHGRQGYSLSGQGKLKDLVDAKWAAASRPTSSI